MDESGFGLLPAGMYSVPVRRLKILVTRPLLTTTIILGVVKVAVSPVTAKAADSICPTDCVCSWELQDVVHESQQPKRHAHNRRRFVGQRVEIDKVMITEST